MNNKISCQTKIPLLAAPYSVIRQGSWRVAEYIEYSYHLMFLILETYAIMKGKKVFVARGVTHGILWLVEMKHCVASFFLLFCSINMLIPFKILLSYFTTKFHLEFQLLFLPVHRLLFIRSLCCFVGVNSHTIVFSRKPLVLILFLFLQSSSLGRWSSI